MDNNLEQLQKAKEQFKLKNLEENLQENKQEVKLKLNENVQIDSQNEQQLGDLNENLVNIQADKIAEAEAEPEVPAFMNSAVMIEKSFADAKEDDSDRMALIRQALKTYFEKRTELDGMNGADESVRMEKLKEVRAEAVNMLNQCRVYRSHRHPITKRGKERKRQVTELYEQVKIELLQLADYIQDVRRSMSEKTEPTPEPLKDIGLAVAKNGFRRLENIKKDDTLHKTDKKRLADKQFYGDSVNAELQREDLSSKEREVLELLKEYTSIRTTASHVMSSRNIIRESNDEDEKKKYKVKLNRQQKKLDTERDLIKKILKKLPEVMSSKKSENREILKKYSDWINGFSGGTLVVDESKVADFSTGFKLYETSVANSKEINEQKKNGDKEDEPILEREKLEVKNRKDEPLFSHEPCAQDVVQTSFGDCYFIASLAEIVAKDSAAIREMMKDEGDTVTVRFYHKPKKTYGQPQQTEPVFIRVSKEVPKSDGALDTLWVKIMEKAYAAFLQKFNDDTYFEGIERDAVTAQTNYIKSNEIDYVFMANGGQPDIVYEQFTNKTAGEKFVLGDEFSKGKNYDLDYMTKKTFKLETYPESIKKEAEEGKRLDSEAKEYEKVLKEQKKLNAGNNGQKSPEELELEKKKNEARKQEIKTVMMMRNEEFFVNSLGYVSFGEVNKDLDAAGAGFEQYYNTHFKNAENTYNTHKSALDAVKQKIQDYLDQKYIQDGVIALKKEWEDYDADIEAKYDACNGDMQKMMEVGNESNKRKKAYYDAKRKTESEAKNDAAYKALLDEEQNHTEEMKKSNYDFMVKAKNIIDEEKNSDDKKLSFMSVRGRTIHDLSKDMVKCILNDKFKRTYFLSGNDTKSDYEAVLQGVDSFKLSEWEALSQFYQNNFKTLKELNGITDDDKAFEIVKKQTKLWMEKMVSGFDKVYDEKMYKSFTGVYSSEANDLFDKITEKTNDGRFIAAGTKDLDGQQSQGHHGEKILGGIAGTHAYSVYGTQIFKYNGKEIKMIKLRNPWGVGVPVYQWDEAKQEFESVESVEKSNGTFYCELTHFAQCFGNLYNFGK